MIVVRVELHSAITGTKTELARLHICNDESGGQRLRNYVVRVLRGRSTASLDGNQVQRQGEVKQWPSEAMHVWNLVAAGLAACGYGAHAARRLG